MTDNPYDPANVTFTVGGKTVNLTDKDSTIFTKKYLNDNPYGTYIISLDFFDGSYGISFELDEILDLEGISKIIEKYSQNPNYGKARLVFFGPKDKFIGG